jgi:hypothetical protein
VIALLAVVSGGFMLAASVPAVLGTWRRDNKPVVMSWAIWAALLAIGGAASVGAARVSTLCCAAECTLVTLLALRIPVAERDEPFRVAGRVRLDLLCLPGAVAGLVLLAVLRAPAAAVTVTVVTDAVAYVPTVPHAWRFPRSEPWAAYSLCALGAALALVDAALRGNLGAVTATAYPAYLAVSGALVASLVLVRQRTLYPSA